MLLILEGVSSLSWSGVNAVEVQRLLRAIQIQAEKVRPAPPVEQLGLGLDGLLSFPLRPAQLAFSTITHLHTTPSTGSLPTDPLFQLLHESSDLWIKVAGLSSGRSADVSGEVRPFPPPFPPSPPFPRPFSPPTHQILCRRPRTILLL